MATKKIYLDVCCWERPFDDQTQTRVHLESEALLAIVLRIERGEWSLITSEAVDLEIGQLSDSQRRERIQAFIPTANVFFQFGDSAFERAVELERLGFRGMDALHLAAAERSSANVLLTTDDGFLKTASRHRDKLHVLVENPLIWLQTVLEE